MANSTGGGLLALAAVCVLTGVSVGCAAAGPRISVTDFGAKPGDGKDDTAAVNKAIAAAIARPGATLVFPKGRYDFAMEHKPGKGIFQLSIHGARGLVIDGRGSKLMFSGRTAPFHVTKSRDVVFKNLTIDWDDPIFSSGIITESSPTGFTVELAHEYTGPDSQRIENIVEWDPKTHLPLKGGKQLGDLPHKPYKNIKPTRKIGPKKLRVDLNVKRQMSKGAYVTLVHQNYIYNAFTASDCQRLALLDVNIYYAPGMALYSRLSEDILIRRLRVEPRPKSGRVLSLSADAIHISDCTGTVRIEDSYFQGMGDDAANIHGDYLNVTALVNKRMIEATHRNGWPWPPRVGDVMEFTTDDTLEVYATGKVTAVDFDHKTKTHRIAFAKPLPKLLKLGHYITNGTRVPKVRMRGNRVYGNRARGFVVKARDVIIENNTLESVSGCGISIGVEAKYWREAIGTRDVIVRNNTLIDCNGGPSRSWGAIAVFALLEGKGHRMAGAGVHRNVRVENNTIRGTDGCGIFLASTDELTVKGNKISDYSRAPSRPGGRHGIHLEKSSNVTISGNTLSDPGAGMAKALYVGKGVDKDTLSIKGNKGLQAGPRRETK